jgi:DNA polymerase elongation subunit (family B)
MATIRFFPLEIESKESIIRIFGKTADNKKIYIADPTFSPYILVAPKPGETKRLQEKLISIKENDYYVTSIKKVEKDDMGIKKEFLKVNINNPEGISPLVSLIKKIPGTDYIKEQDIKFNKRYIIDKNITPLTLCEVEGDIKNTDFDVDIAVEGTIKNISSEIPSLKLLSFDIEILDPINIGDFSIPIISIALASKDYKKVITWKDVKNPEDYIEVVKDESELIEKFVQEIKLQKPDCIIGYFSDGFDFPYVISRAKKLETDLDINLDNTNIRITRALEPNVKIKGIIHIDVFKFIKKIMANSLNFDSYSLDFVAKELLGEQKKDFDIRTIRQKWENNKINEICEYNLHDAVITLKLAEKILPNIIELVKITSLQPFDICRSSYGKLVESYLMKNAYNLNKVIQPKPAHEDVTIRRMYTYQGAYVMEPKPGLYENIIIFDFMSLYPTIVIAKNICPSTLEKKGRKEDYQTPKIQEEGNIITYHFTTQKEGFIPTVVKDLIIRRNRIKELLKEEENPVLEARSYALKTIANSIYGYTGFFGARWYSKECASSITAFAREYIQDVINKTKKEGFQVVYSDTDSVAITLGKKTEVEAINFLKKINTELPSLMELELEGFYPRGIFVAKKTKEAYGAKKKYALIDQKGKIKIRGFETVRRDWSPIARETQKKVLEIILKENSPIKALNYVKEIINKLKEKEIPLNKLIIQTQLIKEIHEYEQIAPHVAIAKKLMEKQNIRKGSHISYIITEGKGLIREKAKIPEECQEKEYDPEYYINNQIIPVVEKIFEVLGYKKEDLIEKGQKKLNGFV